MCLHSGPALKNGLGSGKAANIFKFIPQRASEFSGALLVLCFVFAFYRRRYFFFFGLLIFGYIYVKIAVYWFSVLFWPITPVLKRRADIYKFFNVNLGSVTLW